MSTQTCLLGSVERDAVPRYLDNHDNRNRYADGEYNEAHAPHPPV
jgi:hypothetical protein